VSTPRLTVQMSTTLLGRFRNGTLSHRLPRSILAHQREKVQLPSRTNGMILPSDPFFPILSCFSPNIPTDLLVGKIPFE